MHKIFPVEEVKLLASGNPIPGFHFTKPIDSISISEFLSFSVDPTDCLIDLSLCYCTRGARINAGEELANILHCFSSSRIILAQVDHEHLRVFN